MGTAQRARLRHPRRSQPRHRLTIFEPVGEGRTRVTIWVDMHDLGDSMADAVRPIGVHGQHGPSAGRGPLGAESAPSRLGEGRHYGSSARHLPGRLEEGDQFLGDRFRFE